jgi:hypothetical protein
MHHAMPSKAPQIPSITHHHGLLLPDRFYLRYWIRWDVMAASKVTGICEEFPKVHTLPASESGIQLVFLPDGG